MLLLNQLRILTRRFNNNIPCSHIRLYGVDKALMQTSKPQVASVFTQPKNTQRENVELSAKTSPSAVEEMYPTRVVPVIMNNKETIVLSFDEVPGPKTLKYFSSVRHYLSQIGTQITAGVLTMGLNIGTYISSKKPLKNLSYLFDEYGPVVRFVSPIGKDIVLLNHPEHIQKVYDLEGDYPVRSSLDSLEKYRTEHKQQFYSGLYGVKGEEWSRQRTAVYQPLNQSVLYHIFGIQDVCDSFVHKIGTGRNYQDQFQKDLYKEIHKWAFDCVGLVIFSKKFTMLETEMVYSQCDMSWLYHSLEKATDAIIKCESGIHMWKLFPTPAWNSLVKHCDSLDNLIGKHVLEAEQKLITTGKMDSNTGPSLISSLLMSKEKMKTEDVTTALMDMLLLGVNTMSSSMAFLLYFLAKHTHVQKKLYQEICDLDLEHECKDNTLFKSETPYLQACIKETLRLVPPIPVLTRILPKSITLDKYNIPRGTLLIMSTRDSALNESNFEDATRFYPERWLKEEAKNYHAFASMPFGFGARKCLAQNVAETMISVLTIKILQKYRMEYHYGKVEPTRSFIARPNKQLKIRFIDRS